MPTTRVGIGHIDRLQRQSSRDHEESTISCSFRISSISGCFLILFRVIPTPTYDLSFLQFLIWGPLKSKRNIQSLRTFRQAGAYLKRISAKMQCFQRDERCVLCEFGKDIHYFKGDFVDSGYDFYDFCDFDDSA